MLISGRIKLTLTGCLIVFVTMGLLVLARGEPGTTQYRRITIPLPEIEREEVVVILPTPEKSSPDVWKRWDMTIDHRGRWYTCTDCIF